MRMNKQKKMFAVGGIVLYLVGLILVILCSVKGEIGIHLSLAGKVAAGAGGVLLILAAIACLIRYMNCLVEEDEEIKIAEKDERNVMIRGKAAQDSMLITTILLLSIELILICTRAFLASVLVCGVMVISNWGQVYLINYYGKKY